MFLETSIGCKLCGLPLVSWKQAWNHHRSSWQVTRRAWQAVQKTYMHCGKAWLDDGSRATYSHFNPYQKWKTEECVPKKHCHCTWAGGQRVLCWMLVVPGRKGWPRTSTAFPGRPVVMGGRFGVFCAWNWWGTCGTSGTPSLGTLNVVESGLKVDIVKAIVGDFWVGTLHQAQERHWAKAMGGWEGRWGTYNICLPHLYCSLGFSS